MNLLGWVIGVVALQFAILAIVFGSPILFILTLVFVAIFLNVI